MIFCVVQTDPLEDTLHHGIHNDADYHCIDRCVLI